jgi:hypothetical protein
MPSLGTVEVSSSKTQIKSRVSRESDKPQLRILIPRLEYGFEPDPNDADGVRVFNVVGSRTKITLRWQNGTTTTDWASDLLPYYHVDE